MIQNDKIGIVLVNYNGAAFQNECIQTICEQTYTNYRIIVVDSGSTDHSIEMLQKKYEDVTVLKQYENCGVARGNNIGMEYAFSHGCAYVLLLNNDTELAKDMLENMMKEAGPATAAVPKIYYYDDPDKLWFAGGVMNWKQGNARHTGLGERDHGQYDRKKRISYAPTCAMLLHKNMIKEIGGFDEKLFMYWDDTDLCARMIEHGFSIKYIPKAMMWHKVSSSSGGESSKLYVYYVYRNQLYFLHKYRKKIRLYTYLTVYMKALCKFLLSPVRIKNEKYIPFAFYDYYKGNMGRKDFG